MHTTPWFHATDLANVPAVNLVQVGIGGWQVPREGVEEARKRNTNIFTMRDVEETGPCRNSRTRPGTRLEGCRRGLYLLRHRQRRLRLRAGHGLAGAGRLPAARGAGTGLARRRGGHLRAGGRGGLAALRHLRHHRASATRVIVDVLGTLVSSRQDGHPQGDHRQAGHDSRRDRIWSRTMRTSSSRSPPPRTTDTATTHPHGHGPGHNHRRTTIDHLHTHVHGILPNGSARKNSRVLATTFVDGFRKADDKTCYLRLAGIPFRRKGRTG